MKNKLKIYIKESGGYDIIVLSPNHGLNRTYGLLLSNTEYHRIGHNSGYWTDSYLLDRNKIVSLSSDDTKTIYKSSSNNILIHTNNYPYSNIISSDTITKIRNDDINYISDSIIYHHGHGHFHKIKNVKFKNK